MAAEEIVYINSKVSDRFFCAIDDFDFDGYVPKDIGIGGGDYLEFEIEISTGKIIGWDKDKFLEWIKTSRDIKQ